MQNVDHRTPTHIKMADLVYLLVNQVANEVRGRCKPLGNSPQEIGGRCDKSQGRSIVFVSTKIQKSKHTVLTLPAHVIMMHYACLSFRYPFAPPIFLLHLLFLSLFSHPPLSILIFQEPWATLNMPKRLTLVIFALLQGSPLRNLATFSSSYSSVVT